ncbi:MAG: class I SAM-dependent methyltransferase [Candidatus Latescibacteria bacterium]|nr:class I SAM-dependent methyltransferase [Candidatus Latescibacterota bacterium]
MPLYEDLSAVYDIVFPENKQATQFIAKSLKPKSRLLDLACGTGNYTHALTLKGHTVVGIDLDHNMIHAAKRKYPEESSAFFVGDMFEIDSIFNGRRFDAVYSIGNSLVHIPDRETVGKLAGKVFDLLNTGGMFIIQIVNYDRIRKYRIDSLPPIERKEEGVRFLRNYAFTDDPDHVFFNTELIYGDKTQENSVWLLALQSGDLKSILKSAGFSGIHLYGGYDGSEHGDESPATIFRAIT